MITYNKYINSEDHTWYDSSNVVFSKCYDNDLETKTLKVVFKNGRTYLYKDVSVNDYIAFKSAPSTGEAINKFIIKKYKGVRIADTDIEQLNECKNDFITRDNQIQGEPISNLDYHLKFKNETGEFQLLLGDKVIYTGVEGSVSIVNLLKSMNINYSWEEVNEIISESDENKDEIIL